MTKPTRVYLKPGFGRGKLHTLYGELISHPPQGCEIFTSSEQNDVTRLPHTYNLDMKTRTTSNLIGKLAFELKPFVYLPGEKLFVKQTPPCDLVYASQHLHLKNEPWITDFEFVNALTAYGSLRSVSRFDQRKFESNFCKKIIPWSNWACSTLIKAVDCRKFMHKLEAVHYTVSPKSFTQRSVHDDVRILFVGTINSSNLFNFERKGVPCLVKSFVKLREKYSNVSLTVRSWVPKQFKDSYSNTPGLRFIDQSLDRDKLDNLYVNADIYAHPGFETLGISVLSAMSFGLPVIGVNLFDVPEAVRNGETGFVLQTPSPQALQTKDGVPCDYTSDYIKTVRKYNDLLVNELVEKLCLLIEDSSYRRKLGNAARHSIETGEFSISVRNQKLRRIFEEALRA